MIVSSNLSSITAHGELQKTNSNLSKSLEKLSSGYKVNSSADDSVAMAMSEKMRMQIRALDRAGQNASDGISLIQTAEGALNEVTSILQRMRELAVQGASDTYGDEDREKITQEMGTLKDEIDRIARDTEFNNNSILNGDLERKAYNLDDTGKLYAPVQVVYTDDSVKLGTYKLSIAADSTVDFQYSGGIRVDFTGNATITVEQSTSSTMRYVTINDVDNFSMTLAVDTSKVTAASNMNINVKDMGAMVIQLGGDEGQTVDLYIPEVTSRTLGIGYLDTDTTDGCEDAIKRIDDAITKVSKIRAKLGSSENRFTSAVSSLEVTSENMTAALSRIRDVDMAEEMTNYTQLNVLQQAGISVLGQSNQLPERVLQLLQ